MVYSFDISLKHWFENIAETLVSDWGEKFD